MSKRLIKHATVLKLLQKSSPSVVRNIIRKADRKLLNTLCECSLNILKGNIALSKPQLIRLKKYKSALRNLVERKTSLKKKKAILQTGGFLSALLTPLLGVLGGLLGKNK